MFKVENQKQVFVHSLFFSLTSCSDVDGILSFVLFTKTQLSRPLLLLQILLMCAHAGVQRYVQVLEDIICSAFFNDSLQILCLQGLASHL